MHDNRRSAIRNMIRAGIPRDIAKKLSGHETDSVFSRYNIINEENLHDATAKFGRLGDITGTVEPEMVLAGTLLQCEGKSYAGIGTLTFLGRSRS
jgi:hypothetical protein